MQLVAVVLQPVDEFFDGAFRLEGEEGQAVRDVAPLARVVGQAEPLAEFLDDVFGLFFLGEGVRDGGEGTWLGGVWRAELTFSMNEKMYFIVLWNVSSSTECAPTER